MPFIELLATYIATTIAMVFMGWCFSEFIIRGVPMVSRKIENHYRERGEVDFWLMVAVVHHEIPEHERDVQIQRFVKWSDRRWDAFKKKYEKQKILTDLLPDIEMLRALK